MDAGSSARRVLLIGSLPNESRAPREVFELVSAELSPLISYLPDGEQSVHGGWFWTQIDAIQQSASLEPDIEPAWSTGRAPDEIEQLYAAEIRERPILLDYYRQGHEAYKARAAAGGMQRRSMRVRGGITPKAVEIGNLGVADTEIASYEAFVAARDAGTISPSARYQMSLPTPFTFLQSQIRAEDIVEVLPAYERALSRELDQISCCIPADDLVVQWDAVEFNFGFLEEPTLDRINLLTHLRRPKFALGQIVGSVARVSRAVPRGANIGFHLCYGDAIWGDGCRHHALEPADMGLMVDYTSCLIESGLAIDYVHMTVPVERDDDAYFAPLRNLSLPPGVELFLGLIHETDGVPGAMRRAETAKRYVSDFGVACECGLGRRSPGSTAELLKLHREVATAV